MVVDGKTVVVTGVGPGLGGEVARVVLRDGGNAVLAARTQAKLEKMAAELDPSGEHVAWRATDINSADDCRALMDLATERFGGVDGIVQVAAYDTAMGGLDETTDDVWRDVLATNVTGTMHVVSAAAAAMEGRGGSVVLIGSQSSVLPAVMFQLAYASSKGALTAAMFHLAKELGPKKIRVNQVVPTWMWGPPVEGYVDYAVSQGQDRDAVIGEITKDIPLGIIPDDADCANAVAFLASDLANVITGAELNVNGGEFML